MTAARVLRWLADELEAGRALIELEIVPERDVVERPRSMLDDPAARLEHGVVDLGARLRLTATTTRRPPTLRPPAPVAWRSCRKARKGATPVPGPIMMTSRSVSTGGRK